MTVLSSRRSLCSTAPLLACALLASCASAEPPAHPAAAGSATVKTVSLRTRAITTTALTVASGANPNGSGVTLLATVDGKSGTALAGSVVFTVQGKSIGKATLANGSASLTVGALPSGLSTLAASYQGDENYLPSTSAAVRFYNDDQD